MNNKAIITWVENEQRYELRIDDKLKAYTQDDHAAGMNEMIEIVEKKGYVAIVRN